MNFKITSDEFEELVIAVLSLRIKSLTVNPLFTTIENGIAYINRAAIFLLDADVLNNAIFINLGLEERGPEISFPIETSIFRYARCDKQIRTSEKSEAFRSQVLAAGGRINLSYLNCRGAKYADGFEFTVPDITFQIKQSTISRQQQDTGKTVPPINDFESEISICRYPGSVFLFVSDDELRDTSVTTTESITGIENREIFIVDAHRRSYFFGEELTHILRMCLTTSDVPSVHVLH
jgi:hypothetical protein